MGFREAEDGECLGNVGFKPGAKFRRILEPFGGDLFETGIGFAAIGGVEDGAQIAGDIGSMFQARYQRLGVALEMELAALPGNAGKAHLASGFETGVIVADDELDAMEAAFLEGLQEIPPVQFGFAEFAADSKDATFTVAQNAGGNENGTGDDVAVVTDLFVAGIEDEIRTTTQRTSAP